MKKKPRRSLVGIALLSLITVMAVGGACSQYAPGPYEGGGRSIPTSVVGDIGEGTPETDSSVPDVTVPETGGNDVVQLPDVGGQ